MKSGSLASIGAKQAGACWDQRPPSTIDQTKRDAGVRERARNGIAASSGKGKGPPPTVFSRIVGRGDVM